MKKNNPKKKLVRPKRILRLPHLDHTKIEHSELAGFLTLIPESQSTSSSPAWEYRESSSLTGPLLSRRSDRLRYLRRPEHYNSSAF